MNLRHHLNRLRTAWRTYQRRLEARGLYARAGSDIDRVLKTLAKEGAGHQRALYLHRWADAELDRAEVYRAGWATRGDDGFTGALGHVHTAEILQVLADTELAAASNARYRPRPRRRRYGRFEDAASTLLDQLAAEPTLAARLALLPRLHQVLRLVLGDAADVLLNIPAPHDLVETGPDAVDIVLLVEAPGGRQVLVIRRGSDPFAGRLALPGGMIETGESPKEAAVRELAEETNLYVPDLQPIGLYDEAGRDPRGPVASVAFTATLNRAILPVAGDDAAAAFWTPVADPASLAFDHHRILKDALALVDQEATR